MGPLLEHQVGSRPSLFSGDSDVWGLALAAALQGESRTRLLTFAKRAACKSAHQAQRFRKRGALVSLAAAVAERWHVECKGEKTGTYPEERHRLEPGGGANDM